MVQKYAIQAMVCEDKTLDEIVAELAKDSKKSGQSAPSERAVLAYIKKTAESIAKIEENKIEEEEVKPKKESRFHKALITKTAGKGNKGVTILTEAASGITDSKRPRKRKNRRYDNSLFKPKGNNAD